MSQIEKHLVEIDTNLKYQESETFLKTSYKDIDQFNSLFISKVICVDFFFLKGPKPRMLNSISFHILFIFLFVTLILFTNCAFPIMLAFDSSKFMFLSKKIWSNVMSNFESQPLFINV
jgi:hypothetical protein